MCQINNSRNKHVERADCQKTVCQKPGDICSRRGNSCKLIDPEEFLAALSHRVIIASYHHRVHQSLQQSRWEDDISDSERLGVTDHILSFESTQW